MARKLDIINVIDLEATCWEKGPNDGQKSEIIEIGICTVNVANLTRLTKESILVKPEFSVVSPFCTELTSITTEMVADGIKFEDAVEHLKGKYNIKNRLWASYGDYDRRQFERVCKLHNLPYPFGPTHLNVKNLFAIYEKLNREVGMDYALKRLHTKLEGTHHRAADDAWNIARILCYVLEKK